MFGIRAAIDEVKRFAYKEALKYKQQAGKVARSKLQLTTLIKFIKAL